MLYEGEKKNTKVSKNGLSFKKKSQNQQLSTKEIISHALKKIYRRDIILNILKRSTKYLLTDLEKGKDIKRHKPIKYSDMEKVVYEWLSNIKTVWI